MRRNMSGNLGLYKYLWPGSVYMYIYRLSGQKDLRTLKSITYISDIKQILVGEYTN